MCLQGAVLVNDAARIVDRHLSFREGIAYGIDRLLEPPGLGAHCDTLENRTTYVCNAYRKLAAACYYHFKMELCFIHIVSGALWTMPKTSSMPLPTL